ncbi:MAG TPA: hypothetical protein VJB18_07925 [Burkholderiales bacterium]|nr:hypothetical protein [Burkholderiales bacterium]
MTLYEHVLAQCPVCQLNVETHQGQINKTYGTKFKMPVVHYSQLMTVAYGGSAKGETEGPRVSGEHSRRRTGMPWTACPGFSSGAR